MKEPTSEIWVVYKDGYEVAQCASVVAARDILQSLQQSEPGAHVVVRKETR